MKKEDIDKIFLLGRPYFALSSEYSWDWSKEKIRQYLKKKVGFGTVCSEKNSLTGFALVETDYSSQKPDVAWLTYIMIDRKYRNKSVGTELLNEVLKKLKKLGKKELITDIYVKNKASIDFFNDNRFKVEERWLSMSRKVI